jgi:hypothetical protein
MRAAIIAAGLLFACANPRAKEPPRPAPMTDAIRARDREFFQLFFQRCEPALVTSLLTADFEMYHDKGGLVARGAEPFVEQYAKDCAARREPGAWRSRRELVSASLRVYPVGGWGAFEEGDHIFYERKGDGPEKLAGRAHFVQVWKLEDGVWKLARVFSYAHATAD